MYSTISFTILLIKKYGCLKTFRDLTTNIITVVEEDAFAGLENLRLLALVYNNIYHIPKNAFAPLGNLLYL
ncbi:hypothetical protein TrispH2_003006 [Trichoplax sp. H2]|nr:hypothetical protein TrispH2_003006 [Trichoplax sp. H2]|eukprot:RDD45096.1 hypothetical protein TrispH2_003006 [Trichoplax sp. H2]